MLENGAVEFVYQTWATRFPEFSNVSAEQAAMFFEEAGLFLNNTAESAVDDLAKRSMILNLIAAHIAFLGVGTAESPANSALVGRVTSATQGSVSIGIDGGMMGNAGGLAAWFLLSRYGQLAWAALAPYRLGGRVVFGNIPDLDVVPRQFRFGQYGNQGGFFSGW